MLKKFISILILSAVLVLSFCTLVFADEEICPYSDTSIIPLSREEFLTTYGEQLGLSTDGSEIPEDDYIYLVRNELGNYGDLFRFDNSGRMIVSYEFRISLGLDVEIDYATMKEVGFLNNILDLDFLHNQSNVIGAFKFYNTEDLYYPIEYDIICSEPIVTEFFLFVKSDNFSSITYAAATIENISGRNYMQEIYSSDIAYNSKPLISKVDGELSNSVTVGEGGNVHTVTYLDTDETVLWESLVPTGVKASNIFLNLETIILPGAKYIFSGWTGYSVDPVTSDMTFVVEYSVEPDPRGDINDDAKVDARDVVMLLIELENGGADLERERADVNLDGVVNYEDVTYILETLAEAREW